MTTNVTITVNVSAVNDVPDVVGTSFTVAEDGVLTLNPGQIFDPGPDNESSQTVSLSVVTQPDAATGSATINAQGQLVVTPLANYFGPMTLRVRGTDNGTNPANQSTETDLTITVTSVNDAPSLSMIRTERDSPFLHSAPQRSSTSVATICPALHLKMKRSRLFL